MSKEPFLQGHALLGDEKLLRPHPAGPFTPLEMFVCTYVASLVNLHRDVVDATNILCRNPHGCVLAVNSNYGHAAQPGYEKLIKRPKKKAPETNAPVRNRQRKEQGDGTCFNSAVEVALKVHDPRLADKKIFHVKCFPSTGETQVPGSVLAGHADGVLALEAFVAYLSEVGLGDSGDDGRPLPVVLGNHMPIMINYKFRLHRAGPRILANLQALAEYFCALERGGDGGVAGLRPPFPIRETKTPEDDVKLSFGYSVGKRTPRVNIFQTGKINVLGAASDESVRAMYDFFVALFAREWARFVTIQPRRDDEAAAPAEPEPAEPDEPFTDDDLAAVLRGLSLRDD